MFGPIERWRSQVTRETSRYTPYFYVKRYRYLKLILFDRARVCQLSSQARRVMHAFPYIYNVIRV